MLCYVLSFDSFFAYARVPTAHSLYRNPPKLNIRAEFQMVVQFWKKAKTLRLIAHVPARQSYYHNKKCINGRVRLSPFPRVESRFNTHNQNAFATPFETPF